MASAKDIVKRRNSIVNIRKITKTMEKIATARFQKTYRRCTGARSYLEKIAQIIDLLYERREFEHPLMQNYDESRRVVVLVVTSNRGLCGGYNGNILRLARKTISQWEEQGKEVQLRACGRKAAQYFQYIGRTPTDVYTQFDANFNRGSVDTLTNELILLYAKKQIDSVQVVFTCFRTAAQFYPEVLTLLPLSPNLDEYKIEIKKTSVHDYLYLPSGPEILCDLIPLAIQTRLLQCFLDATAAEQAARMRAMKAATDSAGDMIHALSRLYNQARQSNITGELLDIIGGVEALK